MVAFPKPDMSEFDAVALSAITPSPENDILYKPCDASDPGIISLADSIKEHGLREPIVLTLDGYIISGHRRYAACCLAKLESVPVRYEMIKRGESPDEHLQLLREYNRQRVKTRAEQLREEAVLISEEEAYAALLAERQHRSEVNVETLHIPGEKTRSIISKAKRPMLDAVEEILDERTDFLPMTVRAIHYALLYDPPLRHANKRKSTYTNDKNSYKDLTDLVTRARISGEIPFKFINDETRPVVINQGFASCGEFIERQVSGFMNGYWRSLQQSQPNHIEIISEKSAIAPAINAIAAEFCIPAMCGRGYSSITPRYEMAQRFRRSGKDKLIILILSDHDPDGLEIAISFSRSMRDDFGIDEVTPFRVALTPEQIDEYDLPRNLEAKESSPNYRKFVDEYGTHAVEVDALGPKQIQTILRSAINSVMDVDAFNAEIDSERRDAAFLANIRSRLSTIIADELADDLDETC